MARTAEKKSSARRDVRAVFSVRFSAQELEQLRSEAEARETSVAAIVRTIVLDAFRRSGSRPVLLGADTIAHICGHGYGQLADDKGQIIIMSEPATAA